MKKYRTVQGDTWDIIALRMYPNLGGEMLMHVLLEHNQEYRDIVIFPVNIELNIPDVDTPVSKNLPPWVRSR